jgi:hypothetical protein
MKFIKIITYIVILYFAGYGLYKTIFNDPDFCAILLENQKQELQKEN